MQIDADASLARLFPAAPSRYGAAEMRVFTATLLLLAGCGGARPFAEAALVLPDPPRREPVGAAIDALPMDGQNVARHQLFSGPESSLFLVRIADREQPHIHTEYDLIVTILEGGGTLWLDGADLEMTAGDVAHVPRGAPHYFVNRGDEPASALVVFSPSFTDPDVLPIEP